MFIKLLGRKGQLRTDGYYFNSNLWRLNINGGRSLFKFINIIKPFVKHGKRRKDMMMALDNIKNRKNKGTIYGL